ncbi:MAG TPA: flagellar biosynthetic protein FliO [Nevskiaceae bacterium]|nr:flagellar biosynthetic protein FliO [Nevskiaceae bacterium]
MAASLFQMILSLAGVVAMILALAWLSRRMQGLRVQAASELKLRASLSVGLKERVVLLDACGQQVLIGVAPGQVSILKVLGPVPAAPEAEAIGAPPKAVPNFADHLRTLLTR